MFQEWFQLFEESTISLLSWKYLWMKQKYLKSCHVSQHFESIQTLHLSSIFFLSTKIEIFLFWYLFDFTNTFFFLSVSRNHFGGWNNPTFSSEVFNTWLVHLLHFYLSHSFLWNFLSLQFQLRLHCLLWHYYFAAFSWERSSPSHYAETSFIFMPSFTCFFFSKIWLFLPCQSIQSGIPRYLWLQKGNDYTGIYLFLTLENEYVF